MIDFGAINLVAIAGCTGAPTRRFSRRMLYACNGRDIDGQVAAFWSTQVSIVCLLGTFSVFTAPRVSSEFLQVLRTSQP